MLQFITNTESSVSPVEQVKGVIAGGCRWVQVRMKEASDEEVSRVIASLGGNVVSVYHERSGELEDINDCELRIKIETRNAEHIQQIKEQLQKQGFQLK